MQEPPKADQLRYNADPEGHRLPRVALCIIQLPDGTTVVEALVAVSAIPPVVLSWEEVLPPFSLDTSPNMLSTCWSLGTKAIPLSP